MKEPLGFVAQLKSVRHNVAASGDNEYTVIIKTHDPRVLKLGEADSRKTIGVAITTDLPENMAVNLGNPEPDDDEQAGPGVEELKGQLFGGKA